MPRAYSADLRERVLQACERGMRRAAIAAQFLVSATTLYRWQQQWRREGRRLARRHAGGAAPRLDAAARDALAALVAEANDLTLAEYAARLAERTGTRVSPPTLCRVLQRLGLGRKKASGRPSRTAPTSPRRAPPGAMSWPRSTPPAWSSSTRAA